MSLNQELRLLGQQDPRINVIAEVEVREGGLNKAEGSFCGITIESWHIFLTYLSKTNGNDKERGIHLTRNLVKEAFEIEEPAQFENLREETKFAVQAKLVAAFYLWYFQRPPKQNYFALPEPLWLIVCDAATLAYFPVNRYVQFLSYKRQGEDISLEDNRIDGIWGSGTTTLVQDTWANASPADLKHFGASLTELVCQRYDSLVVENPAVGQQLAEHWKERAVERFKQSFEQDDTAEAVEQPENALNATERTQDDSEGLDTDNDAPEQPEGDYDGSEGVSEVVEPELLVAEEVKTDIILNAIAENAAEIKRLHDRLDSLGQVANANATAVNDGLQGIFTVLNNFPKALDAITESLTALAEQADSENLTLGDAAEVATTLAANPIAGGLTLAKQLLNK